MDTLQSALQQLPHGPEFRFVDRLTSLVPGLSGSAEYLVKPGQPFLQGHFPGNPLFPGVLLVEAAAQLAGTVAQCDPSVPPLPNLRLTALQKVKILGTAAPGSTIELHARIAGRLGNLVQAAVSARVGDRVLLEGELTLSGGVSCQAP